MSPAPHLPPPVAPEPTDTPAYGELADGHDLLGWDRARHGRFIEHATGYHEAEPVTVPYAPER